MLRSAKRYKALDETAIFGMCCCHEFPKMFLNLKHGERFSYDNYCSKIQCFNLVNKNIGLHILFSCLRRCWNLFRTMLKYLFFMI